MSKIVKAKCVASHVMKDEPFQENLRELRKAMKDADGEGARSESRIVAFYEFQITDELNIFVPMLVHFELRNGLLVQSVMAGAVDPSDPISLDPEKFVTTKEDSTDEYLIVKVEFDDGNCEYLPVQEFGWSISTDPNGEPIMSPFVHIKTADSGFGILL